MCNEYLNDIAIRKAWDYWLATVPIFGAVSNNLVSITTWQKLLCHVFFCLVITSIQYTIYGLPLIFQCVIFRPGGMYYTRMVADPDKTTEKRVDLISYWPWKNWVFWNCIRGACKTLELSSSGIKNRMHVKAFMYTKFVFLECFFLLFPIDWPINVTCVKMLFWFFSLRKERHSFVLIKNDSKRQSIIWKLHQNLFDK